MGKSIVVIILILVSIAAFVVHIRPTYDHVQDIKSKVARLDEALSKTRNIRRLREKLSQDFRDFATANLDRLQKLLPDHVDNVRLVLDIDGMAARHGIRIQNVKVKKKGEISNDSGNMVIGGGGKNKEQYQSLVLQFDVNATYDDFIKFLRDIELSLRIVDLVALKMDSIPAPEVKAADNEIIINEPRYKFTMAFRTYWLK